jgi:hypothetical protein
MLLKDVARFGAHDDSALIAASFCCPYCLRAATAIALDEHDSYGTAEASCSCAECDSAWVVALNDEQWLRMVLAPPADSEIRTLG